MIPRSQSTVDLVFVCAFGLLLLASNAYAETTYGEWLVYTGIEGVGDVSKASPAEDALHYAGNGNPEYGSFGVDVAGAHDYDRRCVVVDGEGSWEVADAHLAASQTNWQCTAGSIVDGGFSTTYTPPTTPQSGISIKVDVYDGTGYNSNDAKVSRSYANTITAFRVGVHLSTSPGGGNYKKWEDGTTEGTVPVEEISTNVNVSGNDDDVDTDTCAATWTLITDPSGCNIHGTIRGSSGSSSSGMHSVYAADTDVWDGGSGFCSVGVNVLVFNFSYGWNTSDSCMAIVSSSIGYGSDYGTEYEETGLTLVSDDFTTEDCLESQSIAANPGTGVWTGKSGADRDGRWKTQVKCQTKEAGGEAANGQGGASANCTFVIPNVPSYLP